jgi:hypothetical protein
MWRLEKVMLTAWVYLLTVVVHVQPSEVNYAGPRNPIGAFFHEPFCLNLYSAGAVDQPPVAKVAFDTTLSIEGVQLDLEAAERSGRFSPLKLGSKGGVPLRFQNTTWPPPPPFGSSADLRQALSRCVNEPKGLCARGPSARLLDRPVSHQALVAKAKKARQHEAYKRGESWQVKEVVHLKATRIMLSGRHTHLFFFFFFHLSCRAFIINFNATVQFSNRCSTEQACFRAIL